LGLVLPGAVGCASSAGEPNDAIELDLDGPIVIMAPEGIGIGTPGGEVDYLVERSPDGTTELGETRSPRSLVCWGILR